MSDYNQKKQLTIEQKQFIWGAACAISVIIKGHGWMSKLNEAFKDTVGTWGTFISSDPDPYDIEILSPYFNPNHRE